MSGDADRPSESPESADEYPLAPDEPSPPSPPLELSLPDDSEQTPEPERFQFSLGELMLLMVAASVFFSVAKLILGEPNLGKLAGLLGFVVLAGMVIMELIGVKRAIVRLAWWTGLALYVLACLAALIFG